MGILPQIIVEGVVLGSMYALVAVAFTLIFGVLGILNVALPDIFMVAAYVSLAAVTAWGGGLGTALVTAIGIGVVSGVIFYAIVLRRLKQEDVFPLFIATLGISMFLQNLVARIAGPDIRSYVSLTPSIFHRFGPIQVSIAQVTLVVLGGIAVLALIFWVERTTMGRDIRALSENRRAAMALGVNVGQVMLVTVVVATVLAALTGVLISNVTGTVDPFVGATIATKMFIVTLVAGGRSIKFTVVIGLSLGLVESLTVAYVGSNWQDVGGLLVLLAVLLAKPKGLSRVVERIG
jgi:branched-chain amino acid transport system permease protein